MREIPLIEDHRLADDDRLAVPNAPTLVPFRVADKHVLDYMPLQFVMLITLDMGVRPAAPHFKVREVRFVAKPELVRGGLQATTARRIQQQPVPEVQCPSSTPESSANGSPALSTTMLRALPELGSL